MTTGRTDQSWADRFRRDAPPELGDLLARLRAAGHAAYVVGGSVRDLLLSRPIADWDVATSAPPEAVAGLFERTTRINARHGTTEVRLGAQAFEVTTFRTDGPYSDGRRPDAVRFVTTIEDDLSRRDFTVNAIALDPGWDGAPPALVDPHGGREDIARRILRTVGAPGERFAEDSLRLLRGARISAILGLELTPETREAMRLHAEGIHRVAAERVRDEIQKALGADEPSRFFDLLRETGILVRVLPELDRAAGVPQNEHHAYDVYEHTMRAVDRVPRSRMLVRLAALFHDLGKVTTREVRGGRVTFYLHERASAAMAETRLRALRYPRREIEHVTHLVVQHMFHYEPGWTDAAVRRFIARAGVANLDDLFALRRADSAARDETEPLPEHLDELRARIDTELRQARAFRVSDLALGGDELKRELGLEEGPGIGRLLRALLGEVLEAGTPNERQALLDRARSLAAGDAPRNGS